MICYGMEWYELTKGNQFVFVVLKIIFLRKDLNGTVVYFIVFFSCCAED